ncbi:MAG: glycosyl hydrolase family 28 protein [Opitutaceae bacterium]
MRTPSFRPFRSLLALPLACASIVASAATYNVVDYGATGGDIRADTAAIQRAIDACSVHGGGQVLVPAGAHYTIATLVLKSHVDLHLERGSLLQGSPNHADFTRFALQPVDFDPGPMPKMGVIVYAEKADDLAITGPGRIDGNDMAYVTKVGPYIYTCTELRPFTVVLRECTHVLLRDFSLTNSAYWTLRLIGCDDASIDSIRIDGDLRMPNNDGIDIDWSSNVRIHGCQISTGDDCISLKTAPLSEGIARPCENIVISGCTLRSRSSGIVLGCDVAGPIRDVVVSDCVIKDSHRGVSVRLSLGGSIDRVLFSNLVIETRIFDSMWWGRGEPIQILALPWTRQSKLGVIRDIRFSNLICNSENGAVIYAEEPGHIENVSFDRVSIQVDRPSKFSGGQQDLRPNGNEGLPDMPTCGFLLRHAAGVTFRDCSVSWGPNPPDYFRYALDAVACPGLDSSGLAGPAAHEGMPPKSIQ